MSHLLFKQKMHLFFCVSDPCVEVIKCPVSPFSQLHSRLHNWCHYEFCHSVRSHVQWLHWNHGRFQHVR